MVDELSFTRDLLGTHITHGANHLTSAGQGVVFALNSSETKVGYPQFAIFIQQQVRWLNIPVNDAELMSLMQGFSHICKLQER